MKTLLSNDDGVTEYGLSVLYELYSKTNDCMVMAPDSDCSGVSNSLTLDRPLRVKEHQNGFMSVNGTPTDCIYLALRDIVSQKFNRVIAGINRGANLGDDILYSGTVAAAMEGRWLDKTAIAISSCGKTNQQLANSAKIFSKILPFINDLEMPKGTILNINIPGVDYDKIAGYKITVLGKRRASRNPIKTIDPRGNVGYWIGAAGEAVYDEDGTDFHAIANNYVSITPLQYDKTNRQAISHTRKWLESIECHL